MGPTGTGDPLDSWGMSNPWLAIDVATAPTQRAREVRRAWERFIGRGPEDGSDEQDKSVRDPIAASWRRSAAAGVDPSGLRIAPVVADADETTARWEVHPLAEMAPLIRSCLAATADDSGHLIVVSDANGVLLWLEGNRAGEDARSGIDELRRGHVVERGRRRHERDRHRAGCRACRPGVRDRALQRGRPVVDLCRGSGP